MKPLTKDLARTGALVALATGSVLIPLRLLHRSAAPSPAPTESVKLSIQTFTPLEDRYVNTIGVAINDNGEVVGTAFDGDKQVRAFVVRNKKAALLPLPKGAPMSVAAGINADGIVVGTVGDAEKSRGILWRGEQVGILSSGKQNTAAFTVSGSSFAAGIVMDRQERGANQWRSTCVNRIFSTEIEAQSLYSGFLDDSAPSFSGMLWNKPGDGKKISIFLPRASNASGTLVGMTVGKNGPIPAVFKNGKIGTLPTPEGATTAVPFAANDSDVFVGAGIVDEKVKPVGWSNGKTGFLPVPGGRRGIALGINDAKTVVGAIETEKGEAHAAVWQGGKVTDLNDKIDQYPGWTLVQARGINNKGWIVGTALHKEDGVIRAFAVNLGR